MKRLLVVLSLCCAVTISAQEAQPATICEEGTEWVAEIGDCAVVVYDQEDIDLEEAKQKAEDMWAKIKSWYEGIKAWKERCMRPLPDYNTESDSAKGIIKVLEGIALITRGLETLQAQAGMELLPGDVITTNEASTAELDLGDTGIIKINEETKFQVPNSDPSKQNIFIKTQVFLGGLWARVKQCTQGEQFEIKTPSAGGGVRG